MGTEAPVKAGRAIASFVFAPVGVITYFMIKNQTPKKAKVYLMLSIVGVAMAVGGVVLRKAIKD